MWNQVSWVSGCVSESAWKVTVVEIIIGKDVCLLAIRCYFCDQDFVKYCTSIDYFFPPFPIFVADCYTHTKPKNSGVVFPKVSPCSSHFRLHPVEQPPREEGCKSRAWTVCRIHPLGQHSAFSVTLTCGTKDTSGSRNWTVSPMFAVPRIREHRFKLQYYIYTSEWNISIWIIM